MIENSIRPTNRQPQPVVVYLVTEDWYFVSHRLPMARAAKRAGFDVHVLTNVSSHGPAITTEGFTLHPLAWKRGTLNPIAIMQVISGIRALYRRIKPDIVHHVALQPSVIGSIAAFGLPLARINALAGMGFAFTSKTIKARIIAAILSTMLRILLRGDRFVVLVQNPDDREAMLQLGVCSDRIALIPGSGVDIDHLRPLPEPDRSFTAAFVGRLLEDKGVRTLVAAEQLLRAQGRPIRLVLAGDPDAANPASISKDEIETWRSAGIDLPGHVKDIRDVWKSAHIAVLPSRREGLPMSLLEAAACGRAIVATDVPGCREIARPGVNALLVPADDADRLAAAISQLAADPALRRRFAVESRSLVEKHFSSVKIGIEIVALYKRMLANEAVQS